MSAKTAGQTGQTTRVASIESDIKGVRFSFRLRTITHPTTDLNWRMARPGEVVSRTQDELAAHEAELAKRRIYRGENVGLEGLFDGLVGSGFTLTFAEGRVRCLQDLARGESDIYRAEFVFHRAPATVDAKNAQYLVNEGKPSFRALCGEALWRVDGVRNTLRNEAGSGWSFNCNGRVPLKQAQPERSLSVERGVLVERSNL